MKSFIATFSLFLLFGCGRVEKEAEKSEGSAIVKGQIFVIRSDRENVKLGGVVLYYVQAKDLRERAKWIALNSQRVKALRNYKADLYRAELWIKETAKERIFQPEFETFIRRSEDVIARANGRLVDNPLLEEVDRIESVREENRNLFEATDFRSDSESQWIITSIYFDWIQKNSTATTETNADGMFRLAIPRASKGYILARASRSLNASREEHYYWIKEVAGSGEEEFMLSSSSTATRQTLNEVLELSEKSQGSSLSLLQKEFSLIPMEWADQCAQTIAQIQKNEARSSSIDEKIRTLEQRIEEVRYESTP